jgi:putative transposase
LEDVSVARKKYSAEEIVAKLCQVDVMISMGRGIAEALESIGVTEVAYYRWQSEYGGLTRTLRPARAASLTKSKVLT